MPIARQEPSAVTLKKRTTMRGLKISMHTIRTIIQRLKNSQAIRQINEELGVHRTIVRRILSVATIYRWLHPDSPMPSDEEVSLALNLNKEAKPHALDVHRDKIKEWHEQGHSAVVITRLLKDRLSCDAQQIRRYCAKKFPTPIDPVMTRTAIPGKAADVDFGDIGFFLNSEGQMKKHWFFSLRLRYSRKTYREVVEDQSTETFCMCHVRAFEYLGGVPSDIWTDCLKAAVIKSTVDNDQLNKTYQSLAEYYGFVICPCLPRTPQHKGGVESDMKYTKNDCLVYFRAKQKEMAIEVPKAQDFKEYLLEWGETIADRHIIQGVGRSPRDLFDSEEKVLLKPLPVSRWELILWKQCEVRRDWRISFEGSFYSVPYVLIGKKVEIASTSSLVRIFHENKEVTIHNKATKKGGYKRKPEHAPPFKEAVLQCTREGLLELAKELGGFICEISLKILSEPTSDKLRPVRNLLGLTSEYSKERLDRACKRAFECKLFSYLSVKNILIKNLDVEPSELRTTEQALKASMKPSRFERSLDRYKSSYNTPYTEKPSDLGKNTSESYRRETYQERLEREYPFSKHGNAGCGDIEMMIALDQEDEERKKQGFKTRYEILKENYETLALMKKAEQEVSIPTHSSPVSEIIQEEPPPKT